KSEPAPTATITTPHGDAPVEVQTTAPDQAKQTPAPQAPIPPVQSVPSATVPAQNAVNPDQLRGPAPAPATIPGPIPGTSTSSKVVGRLPTFASSRVSGYTAKSYYEGEFHS